MNSFRITACLDLTKVDYVASSDIGEKKKNWRDLVSKRNSHNGV